MSTTRRRRARPYWPRRIVVTDSGFGASSARSYKRVLDDAESKKRAGWQTAIITASSWEDARAKAAPIWDRFQANNERKRAASTKETDQ